MGRFEISLKTCRCKKHKKNLSRQLVVKIFRKYQRTRIIEEILFYTSVLAKLDRLYKDLPA